jgi:hypothetical protein
MTEEIDWFVFTKREFVNTFVLWIVISQTTPESLPTNLTAVHANSVTANLVPMTHMETLHNVT